MVTACSMSLVELEGHARFLALVGPVEFPQPAHDLRGILRGGGDGAEVRGLGAVRLGLGDRQHQVAVAEDQRQRVVEIVRDARRHRAQRAEAFLLDGGVLGGAQLQEGVLQLGGAFADLFFEEDVLVLELDVQEAVFQQVADAQQHLGLVERLGEKILGSGGEGAVLGLGGHVGGEDQHGHGIFAGGQRLDLLHDVEAGDIGHMEVEQDEVGPEIQEMGHRLARVAGALDAGGADEFEDAFEQAHVGLFVVNDENFGFADGRTQHGLERQK